jgi:hypothetical protein
MLIRITLCSDTFDDFIYAPNAHIEFAGEYVVIAPIEFTIDLLVAFADTVVMIHRDCEVLATPVLGQVIGERATYLVSHCGIDTELLHHRGRLGMNIRQQLTAPLFHY